MKPNARTWWLLVGGALVFVVGFSLLESVVRDEPRSSMPEGRTDGLLSPAAPEVRQLNDGAIEIRFDLFRRTTIRLDDEDAQQALVGCLNLGIQQTFGDGVEGWGGGRIRSETHRILDECMRRHGISFSIPRPPEGADGQD